MILAELIEDRILEMQKNGPVNDGVYIAQEVLKLTAVALCYHCRNVGKPRRVREQFRHFHTAEYSQECKASVIWQAPILDSVQEGEK